MTTKEEDKLIPKEMRDYLESVRKENDELNDARKLASKFKGLTINGKVVTAEDILSHESKKKRNEGIPNKTKRSWY